MEKPFLYPLPLFSPAGPSLLSPSPFFFLSLRPKTFLPARSFPLLAQPGGPFSLSTAQIGATPSPSPLSAARGPPVGGLLLPPVRAGLQLKESGPSTRRRPAVLARTPRSPAPPLFKVLHPPEPYRIEPPPSSLRTTLAAAAAIVGLAWSSVTPPFPPLPVDFKPPRSFAPR